MNSFCLWCMNEGVPLNTGIWLLSHLQHVARGTSGRIVVGGLITTIALHLGFSGFGDPVLGNERIDLDTLVSMHLCVQYMGRYCLQDEHGNPIPQPPSDEGHDDVPPAPVDPHEAAEIDPSASPSTPRLSLPAPITLTDLMQRMEAGFAQLNSRMAGLEDQFAAFTSRYPPPPPQD